MTAAPTTTQARLSSVIKASRDIMRKDAGLNGDLDRIPQMAWLLFLKAFDDLDQNRIVREPGYQPAIPEPYRWRDWAADPVRRLQGDALIGWVNDTLLPELAKLRGTGAAGDARDTVASIFGETRNRMLSGYLLSDLIDQIDKVHFASADDVHTMAHLYESMLREMRDVAGDSGEFYTPRPIIRLITQLVDPKPSELVMDPAVGTGGFLVEAYEHMRTAVTTPAQLRKVKSALRGFEKKPMPFLLAQMNLMLHEVDRPAVVRGNTLAFELKDQRTDGVDVILTNPPFGGEEEDNVVKHFPVDMRTKETSWLFLQVVMARLTKKKGRAGIVLPNGVLFANEGAGARIKAQLFKNFNLHTVVRLPNGVFSPYTLIPTNLLFFEYGGPTRDVWFYEHPLPEGRKNYTKTKPLRFEEFEPLIQWWGGAGRAGRVENDHAWQISSELIAVDGYNLDLRNPHRPDDLEHRSPTELVAEMIETETEILRLLQEIEIELAEDAK